MSIYGNISLRPSFKELCRIRTMPNPKGQILIVDPPKTVSEIKQLCEWFI